MKEAFEEAVEAVEDIARESKTFLKNVVQRISHESQHDTHLPTDHDALMQQHSGQRAGTSSVLTGLNAPPPQDEHASQQRGEPPNQKENDAATLQTITNDGGSARPLAGGPSQVEVAADNRDDAETTTDVVALEPGGKDEFGDGVDEEGLDEAEHLLEDCIGGCAEELTAGNMSFSVYIGTNQSVYRMGDVVFGTGTRWKQDREAVAKSPEFNNTILQKYFRSRKRWGQWTTDFELLGQLCATVRPQKKPKEHLAIHLRNGDNAVFNNSSRTVLQCATHFRATHRRGANKVRLVTIQHYGANPLNGRYFATPESILRGNEAEKNVRRLLSRKSVEWILDGWLVGQRQSSLVQCRQQCRQRRPDR